MRHAQSESLGETLAESRQTTDIDFAVNIVWQLVRSIKATTFPNLATYTAQASRDSDRISFIMYACMECKASQKFRESVFACCSHLVRHVKCLYVLSVLNLLVSQFLNGWIDKTFRSTFACRFFDLALCSASIARSCCAASSSSRMHSQHSHYDILLGCYSSHVIVNDLHYAGRCV